MSCLRSVSPFSSRCCRDWFLPPWYEVLTPFRSYVFAVFESNITQGKGSNSDSDNSFYRSIPTFLTLFIFAFIYELILVWDALRMKNTIQVIGICVANVAFLVYTAIQIDQINLAVTALTKLGAVKTPEPGQGDLWSRCRPFLVAVPCIISFATLLFAFIAWKLYQEFAWDILKQIGADLRMKKRFLHYQVRLAPPVSPPATLVLSRH